ncbi:timeless protein-domain-containing protein [Mycena leptocephala]|nr:timeless protein-domain-containing protein [Mycena leptocephala]
MSDISSDEEQEKSQDKPLNPRRLLFEPVIGRVVDALGGYEAGTYRMGDEAHGCLKDLKKLWRKDDTDDERTIARIFWEKRVLLNDLIPILLLTAGAGQVEDKRAISCADLMSAMTWPIDMAEELAELDPDERAEFTQLRQSHRHYKAAILQPAVMAALFGLLLPPLAKAPRERTLRDNQVAALVLHIVRNLAAIRDSEGLQSRLVRALQETHLTDLLLTAAANADADPLLASWNTLVLEILFLLFRGTPPIALIEQPKPALQRLLAAEARTAPPPTSRHSRFGTTITVSTNASTSAKALVHTTAPTPLLLDANKRPVRVRAAPAAEAALADDLTPEARTVLRDFARALLKEGAFNVFLSGLLKDIRMERSWATGDRIGMWVLAVVRWATSFFLLDSKDGKDGKGKKREFGQVGAAVESGFVSWVLRRMREATEEKPKGWTTLYAGMGCLTQILLLLDAISASSTGPDDADAEAAQPSRRNLSTPGAPLDLALDCLRACSAATATGRGPAFLDAAVHFAYAVVRMLERGGDGGEAVYGGDDDAEDDAEEERRKKQEARETTFSLEAFEMALRRVVSLIHRVAVRAKAEGLFFKVSTLYLFQTILAAQKTFPRDQPHRDLVSLVNYILRKFFKALEEEPFLAVEAFFPKKPGPVEGILELGTAREGRARARAESGEARGGEVQVKRGYSWSEQLGIVIAALVDAGNVQWVNWTKDILSVVIGQWEKIANEDEDLLAKRMAQKLETPSDEMREKMVDFLIPYRSDDDANAASRDPQVKLLFRLAKFTLMPEEPDTSELQWFVGADVPPADLQRTLKVIDQFLATPINLDGKKASELLTKTRRTRRARSPSPDSDGDPSDGAENSDSDAPKKRKRGKRRNRLNSPNSNSDGDIDAFLEKEKEMRERAVREAAETGKNPTMKATGTKKRRKKDAPAGEATAKRKKKRRSTSAAPDGDGDAESDADVFGSRPVGNVEESTSTPRPRPRPKPKARFRPKNSEGDLITRDTSQVLRDGRRHT